MKTLEDNLRSQERRSLPPEWKAEILANAAVTPAHDAPSTTAWLFPPWLRLGLAAVWAITLTLHLSVPRDPRSQEITERSPSSLPSAWLASNQQRLDQLSTLLLAHDYPIY